MSRTKTTMRRCAESGCNETGLFEYENQREQATLPRQGEWRCHRHTNAHEVLTPDNTERLTVLTVKQHATAPGVYWFPDGVERGVSGFAHGPGFKTWAKDFPEGTRLTISARIELPAVASETKGAE